MSAIGKLFEVRFKRNGQFFTRHCSASCPEQAAKKASKNGRIISVKKVDQSKLFGDIERLQLGVDMRGMYLGGGLYEEDIDLDKVLGLRGNNHRRSDNAR